MRSPPLARRLRLGRTRPRRSMTSSTPVRSPTRWSPGWSAGGRCPCRSSSRQTCTAVMPIRRGPRTSGSQESPTKTTSRRIDAQRRDRRVVDVRVRLARAGAGRRDPGVDQPQQADLVQERIELPAPVRADADGQPGLAKGATASRAASGYGTMAPWSDARRASTRSSTCGSRTPQALGEVTQAEPYPGLVGLLADRVLAVLDPVVAGEVVVEDGPLRRIAVGGEDAGSRSWRHPCRRSGRGCRRSRR